MTFINKYYSNAKLEMVTHTNKTKYCSFGDNN